MYDPVDIEHLAETLHRLYTEATPVSDPRMSMLLLALALGAIFFYPHTTPKGGERSGSKSSGDGTNKSVDRNLAHSLFTLGFDLFAQKGTWLGVFSPCTWETAVCAHLSVSYLLSRGEADSSHAAWQVLGTGIRIAVSLGLHQHASNTSPKMQFAHARVFWELLVNERLQSLNFGRPACVPDVISCRPPYAISSDTPSRTLAPSPSVFHALKYRLCPIYARINRLHAESFLPDLGAVMILDKELRDFAETVPPWLHMQSAGGHEADPSIPPAELCLIIPQRHMLHLLIHKALLFLHRPFFGLATKHHGEPLLSSFASSFAAAVGSARQHTLLFHSALSVCPGSASWWFFIFHLYNAAVIQAQVLLRSPTTMLATEVQHDLELSYSSLSKAAAFSPIAARAVIHLGTIRDKILRKLALWDGKLALQQQQEAQSGSSSGSHGPNQALGMLSSVALRGTDDGSLEASVAPVLPSADAAAMPPLGAPPSYSPGAYDLAALIETDALQDYFTGEFPPHLIGIDPLLQTTLFWHTDATSLSPNHQPMPDLALH